jgi:CBS domain-containing protein
VYDKGNEIALIRIEMFSKEIVIKEIPVLKPEDSAYHALALMDELKLKHIPVVRDGIYLCLLSEKDVLGMENQKNPIENSCFFAPYVKEESTVLDVLQVMSKNRLTLLPVVVGETGMYAGAITLSALTDGLNELCNASSKGALIAVEVNSQDYMLSQIVRLVEANNAKVLNLYTRLERETGKQIVLFRIDLEDASPILRSLERFNFKVKYYMQKQMLTDETLKERLDELLFYLEM